MARYSKSKREEARRLYLTGECATVAEIARRLKSKPHTIHVWKKQENWDELRLKVDRKAAEKLVEQLATARVELNSRHYTFWEVLGSRLFESMKNNAVNTDLIRDLERTAAILDKIQRGQRLARGLSLDGNTEEQIRAQSAADIRSVVDAFFEIVRDEMPDETTRDRIAQRLLERCPTEMEVNDDAA